MLVSSGGKGVQRSEFWQQGLRTMVTSVGVLIVFVLELMKITLALGGRDV